MDHPDSSLEIVYSLDYLKGLLDKSGFVPETKEYNSVIDGSIRKYISFRFPVARNYDELTVYESDDIKEIATSNIFKYRGVNNYEAIWSSELKCIECQLLFPSLPLHARYIMRTVSRYFIPEEVLLEEGNNPEYCYIYSSDKVCVSIGYASTEFTYLAMFKDARKSPRVTLKIENITIKTEEDARKSLEKISNTLFFQMDALYNLTITLAPRRISRDERRRRQSMRADRQDVELRNLRLDYEYDKIPMSLYWFAQTSNTSPIFKYFALYQVLEYYFPIYATMNVKNRIQNLVKDPKFNINKDADVVRLLNLMRSNNVNNIGDEREQLGITLRTITSGEDVIRFIEESELLKEYYKGKELTKLSDKKPRLNDSNGIIDDLAERIYDIRCRIVHNKASETSKKILPMTKEVDYLVNEIEVLKYFAHKAIIANSRPFSLG